LRLRRESATDDYFVSARLPVLAVRAIVLTQPFEFLQESFGFLDHPQYLASLRPIVTA
jgi:hypothetical protein